jgi:parvulin-like peptidyl-prolyl isomerase
VKKKPVLFILLVVAIVAAQSCKSLFKSDYAELKAADLTAFVESRFPEVNKRQLAQSETSRKKFIDNVKKLFAFAQAAEDAGIHKSDEFKKGLELTIEQLLANKYLERNPEVVISKEEWEAYYASHKDQFDAHFKFITADIKEPITDQQKEQQREIWSTTKVRAEKARQAGLDDEPGFEVVVKFEKADRLARLYVRSLQEKHKLTDAEKKKYLAENPGADPDKLKEKAQGLLERVKKGESFEKIAGEFSEDPVSKANGGDLGWFGKGRMEPNFEAAAFALQKGQTSSELVKSRYGYHIIRVEDRRMTAPKAAAAPAPNGQKFEGGQEPEEEIHARHILINTTEAEQFESRMIQEKVNRELEDVTLKFPVSAPTDFIINVAGFGGNRIPGGGQGGSMREINPGENK